MNFIIFAAILCIIDGIAGIAGCQYIPKKYRDKPFSKSCKRHYGIASLIMGIGFIMLYYNVSGMCMPFKTALAYVLLASLPSIIYSLVIDIVYAKKLKAFLNNQ